MKDRFEENHGHLLDALRSGNDIETADALIALGEAFITEKTIPSGYVREVIGILRSERAPGLKILAITVLFHEPCESFPMLRDDCILFGRVLDDIRRSPTEDSGLRDMAKFIHRLDLAHGRDGRSFRRWFVD